MYNNNNMCNNITIIKFNKMRHCGLHRTVIRYCNIVMYQKSSVLLISVVFLLIFAVIIFIILYFRGQTALHKAAWYQRRTICRMLIQAGANVLLKDAQVVKKYCQFFIIIGEMITSIF